MKRKKEAKPIKIDISDNFQPPPKDFKRLQLKELKNYNNEVDEILFNGVLEQIDGYLRSGPMRLIYKALKPGGKAVATVANWATNAAVMSPYSRWPPLCPESFGFFSSDVRKRSNHHDPRLVDIDFDLSWGEIFSPEWATKSDAQRAFAAKHYINAIQGFTFTLTKKGK